ncbi:carbamoyl-phosphate synthase large subunit [Myxococcus faecalis]|jgi:carbamoyl-phosphate synthase large subunit|uniref:carbamoyl-phosphate synthase large subunit n=1 Tax=Myxococcus TaxID=32 RepID=UPI00114285BE|nr:MULTISPECIES: carbamoyl-phosphate synthase large subunit [Myxococcus]MBZ4409143.1 carbamoyl-phosphate synthase large subunit [Myxococcus sp. XM-1-1-1]MCK8499420.1 carbamoyl-phosphate synthase large subunit [Myxococcus fulvus]
MPKRTDIRKVLVIGSGPIVIGQAVEFDYSGTQAIKALRDEGVEVVLLNSNPATVMTDPEFAFRTYIEPITVDAAERILAAERPDSLLPTMGGQTALNLAKALAEQGILEKYGVRLIGASLEAINKAEDRQLFKAAMQKIGVALPKSGYATTLDQAMALVEEIGFPAIIRPSFTLGGTGGGIAYNREEFETICRSGLKASPTSTILVEESVLGWKEYELEVVRDTADNVIIVCSIENLDPMGVHTGDSITVAPAQTLTDREYQRMRQASLAIIREIGVDTGGSNIQFGIHPKDGRMVVIEMNPRVSRSSALASKATGYPIAKIAAKLALGYTLDELRNDITRDTPASFEPTLDYVVVKVPRFNFEKFPHADRTLTTSMRSVGEVMAIGRTFPEAYMKALRSMELGRVGLEPPELPQEKEEREKVLREALRIPRPERPWFVAQAFREGLTVADVHQLSAIDPWFLRYIEMLVREAQSIQEYGRLDQLPDEVLRQAKAHGFSDKYLGKLLGYPEEEVRAHRHSRNIRPVFKRVDTCAAEFEAFTPYLYSTYEEEDEAPPTDRQKVLILGSGPIRIGQGIEFDYACVHAAFALREAGYETVMVNCNPETVSTDYDTSDRLYFEPLTIEDVLEVSQREKPVGAIVQFGGQTPLRISVPLEKAGLPILGTPPDAIDRAEDRERFSALIEKLGLTQPENGVARSHAEAFKVAERIGYPVMVRPSYVLGGRAMETVYDAASLERYMREAVSASPEHPVLIDRFLKDAIEVDLDLVADRTGAVMIGGVLEHIQEAGVHSGDAAATLPPHSLSPDLVERMKDQAIALAQELGVVGLMNVQFAIQGKTIYILEVNPRASRTVPFISKATGVAMAKIAALCMVGKTLAELGATQEPQMNHVAVKESVFPFARFAGVDVILGPEMKSTGEVMGLAQDYASAFAKSQLAAGVKLPKSGKVFISVKDDDKPAVVDLARRLRAMGFTLIVTAGTHKYLATKGIEAQVVQKVKEGRPNIVDKIVDGEIVLVINTTFGKQEIADSFSIRRESLMHSVPYYTTVQAARMAVGALESLKRADLEVKPLQEYLGVTSTVPGKARR